MGWWTETSDSEMVLGDEPFDVSRGLMKEFARVYQEELGRKPTLAEFMRTLEEALQISGHEFFSDFSDKEIKSLTVKTAKRKKRQSFELGDYFAIPVQDSMYSFGRIRAKEPMGYLIDVLDVTDETLKRPSELAQAKPLFTVYVSPDGWEEWRWRILGGHEGYTNENLKPPCFKVGDDKNGWGIRCGEHHRRATAQEVAGLEPLTLWPPQRLEWRLAAEHGLVGIEDVQKMMAVGRELYDDGKYAEATKQFGLASQYAGWIRGNVNLNLLREQALHWLRLSHQKSKE